MSAITTHVLDAVLGKPAGGVGVRLEKQQGSAWDVVGESVTYRLTFVTAAYLGQRARSSIYPEISITFNCDGTGHYHLPLLLSDNSYTAYRGS